MLVVKKNNVCHQKSKLSKDVRCFEYAKLKTRACSKDDDGDVICVDNWKQYNALNFTGNCERVDKNTVNCLNNPETVKRFCKRYNFLLLVIF